MAPAKCILEDGDLPGEPIRGAKSLPAAMN